MVIGDAERGVEFGQGLKDLGAVPALVPELDGEADPLGRQGQEACQPVVVAPKLRRKLDQRRPEGAAQRGHAAEHQGHGSGAVVELLVVGDEARDLP